MRVGIVGGGFAGLAAAIAFRAEGYDVTVFERQPGPVVGGGAISLAPNALACLAILGVRAQVETQRWSGVAVTVRTSDGRVLVRSTLAGLTGGGDYATVRRGQLIGWLTARLPDDCVRYASAVSGVHPDGRVEIGSETASFDLVVGADGTRGVVRRTLWPTAPRTRSTGGTGWAWTVGRDVPDGYGSIWGRTADFGILPLGDGHTYVYGGSTVTGTELSSFRTWPHPLPGLIEAAEQVSTPEIFEARPPRRLDSGKVMLIGDAAHTMRPTFGQGAALAMEDAITLAGGGLAALTRRRARMLALYSLSKAGWYFTHPGTGSLEALRNAATRLLPDPVFGALASSVSHWRASQRPGGATR